MTEEERNNFRSVNNETNNTKKWPYNTVMKITVELLSPVAGRKGKNESKTQEGSLEVANKVSRVHWFSFTLL
jgi:hypothetical protein